MTKRVVTSVLERFATIVLAEGYRGRRRFEIKVGKFTGVCVCAHTSVCLCVCVCKSGEGRRDIKHNFVTADIKYPFRHSSEYIHLKVV